MKKMFTEILSGEFFAEWQEGQINPATGSRETCLFVRWGEPSANKWWRFFGDEIDDVPQDIVDFADAMEKGE